MPQEKKNLSLDSEIIKKGNELVKLKHEVKSFSHLVETLILKDHAKVIKKTEGYTHEDIRIACGLSKWGD